ncbi:MAG: hypothetical protein AAGG81_01725 [Chlamydiota bacterium]
MNEQHDSNKDLQSILHPYLFVLKEGVDIENDYLDYSLLMLHVSSTEVIHSPGSSKVMSFLPTALIISEQVASDNNQANQPEPSIF